MSVVIKKEKPQEQQPSKPSIDASRRKCTLSNEMVNALVKQISHELYNRNVYLTFSNYFKVNHLSKLAEYYKKRADEEDLHARWIIQYLNNCSAEFKMPKINEVTTEIKNLEHPFDLTVDLEIYTTQCINKLVKSAWEEGDYTTFNWLNGDSHEEGKLVLEQREEETTSRAIAGIAHMDVDWLTKQDSILEYYGNI